MAEASARAPRASPIRAIDAHAHVMRRDAPLAPDRHSAPKQDLSAEDYLRVLDAHDISHGVLTAPSFYGSDNTLLLQSLQRHPHRLRGTAIVDPRIDDASLDTLGCAGIVGIRLNWFRRDTLPSLGDYRRVFAALRERRWHVEVYIEGAKLATLLPALRDHGVTIVVDHFGSPDPARGVECSGFREVLAGVRAGDTYVKLSAPYRLGGADPRRYVDALLDAGSGAQLVWASDWPFVSHEEQVRYEDCVGWIRAWICDDATRQRVLVDTPAALFHFDSPEAAA